MTEIWVVLRLTVILSTMFAVPLYLTLRAMARQVREDYAFDRKQRIRGFNELGRNLAVAAAAIVIFGGFARKEWAIAVSFGGFALTISILIWLNKPRSLTAPIPLVSAIQERPSSVRLWFSAAALVASITALDPLMSGRWRLSPGLVVALLWCVGWGLVSLYVRERAEFEAHYR